MGYVHHSFLEPAGKYVLKILKDKGTIRYNENFYFDGEEVQLAWLLKEMGYTNEDDALGGMDFPLHAYVAILQLKESGIVKIEDLPEVRSDGEQDFRITLTQKGRQFLASGQAFQFTEGVL